MSTYREDQAAKTDAELCRECPAIEPEYTRGGVIVEEVMAQFTEEQFQPIAKKVGDHVTEHLWDLLRDHLLSDTALNLEGHMRHRIEGTIMALLGGERWAVEKYVLEQGWRHEEIRASVAAKIPIELQEARVKDLEKENAELRESLRWERARR